MQGGEAFFDKVGKGDVVAKVRVNRYLCRCKYFKSIKLWQNRLKKPRFCLVRMQSVS